MTDRIAAVDSLSHLPECIIHHIMSFLPARDVIRIATVSKWLNYAGLTFPVSDVDAPNDDYFFERTKSALKSEINRLSKRRFSTTLDLQRLWLHGSFDNGVCDAEINKLVALAMENRVKEIDIDHTEELYEIDGHCTLWGNSFLGRSARVLKLRGCHLWAWDLDSVTAQTEELSFKMCTGLETIQINKNSNLKVIKIKFFRGLTSIIVDSSSSLESLTLNWYDGDAILKNCSSLKDLAIEHSEINDASLSSILSQCPGLETLRLKRCRSLQTINFHSRTLKKIEFIKCTNLETIQISAKSLESFTFNMNQPSSCHIDIRQCESIRYLFLCHADIQDNWIEDNLSKFSSLEDLRMRNCNSLRKLRLANDKIKSLELLSCAMLEDVEILSPTLELYYVLAENLPSLKFCRAEKLGATICLKLNLRHFQPRRLFQSLLAEYDRCREVNFSSDSIQATLPCFSVSKIIALLFIFSVFLSFFFVCF